MKEDSIVMGPLDGIVVLDLTRILAGPFCTMMLADYGAEVIKVERPDVGDDTRCWGPPFVNGESAYFLSVNRNKKSIILDFKKKEDIEKLKKLIKKADVLVENFSANFMKKIGLDYESVKKINPRIIYAAISGYGRTGPYKDKPGYDIIAQGMGGIQGITGFEDREPVRVGVAIADIGAGMYLAFGILAALIYRQKTGEGQYIETSLLEGQISWLTYMAQNYFVTGKIPSRAGSSHPNIVPYQAFLTADGRWINIAVGNDSQFKRFCKAIKKEEWIHDVRFSTNPARVKNRTMLIPMIKEIIKTKDARYWLDLFDTWEIPAGPVYTMDQIFEDPQVKHLGMRVEINHPKAGKISQINVPIRMSKTPGKIRSPPPILDEHREYIEKKYLDN